MQVELVLDISIAILLSKSSSDSENQHTQRHPVLACAG